ncbi:MAG TPA: TraR/DksA C4-type zinc finger protein [Acidimicrobiia bacterium]|nr:TraR/DksA C4-type zinc finger protein [Acidimicrobiia bacterium]
MTELTHASLRDELAIERVRIVEQLRQLGHGPGAELDFDEGFADSGQVTAERGEVEALVASLVETLEEIDAALAKFAAGTYGTCSDCGAPIAEPRLEAMPMAGQCISCASQRR